MVGVTGIFITIVLSLVIPEFVCHFFHRLLHNNKVRWLSQNHMIHHLKIYGPKSDLRSPQYKEAIEGRLSFAGIGAEWVLPLAAIYISAQAMVWWFLHIPIVYLILFTALSLLYASLLFNHMHANMHIEGHWLEKNKFTRNWFLRLRKMHDIHHQFLDNEGRMNSNYGICFFYCDRIFGTKQDELGKFNEKGYRAALRRYAYLFKK